MNSSKRVLLTGISGFMGGHIVRHILQRTDCEIVGIASFAHKGTAARLHLKEIAGIMGRPFRTIAAICYMGSTKSGVRLVEHPEWQK